MLKRVKANYSDILVFSKWSRKSYAIFVSLRKIVVISQLSIDVCKSFLLKNVELLNFLGFNEEENDESLEFDINEIEERLSLILLSTANPKNYKKNIISKIYKYCPHIEFLNVRAFF